jgi:hypothetical protein
MIEPLDNLPTGVIGFEAVGTVHSSDYEQVLIPAVDAATACGEIRFVYLLGDRFEGYSAGAAWEDAMLGIDHLRGWKRTALVSDADWVGHLVHTFGWMFPGRVRAFPTAELADAIAWAASDAAD